MRWEDVSARADVDIKLAAITHGADLTYPSTAVAAGLNSLGLKFQFELLDIGRQEFDSCVNYLRELDFRGAVVLNPFKVDAARIAERFWIHRFAMGTANSLLFDKGVFAQNTEVPAITACVENVARGTALVLGTGHAARSVVAGLLEAGFTIKLWNRNVNKTKVLKSLLERYGTIELLTNPDPSGCKLVVNATPIGTKMGEQPPLKWNHVLPNTVFLDLVYRHIPTEFLRAASLKGLRTIDGRELLVEQSAQILEWWTKRQPDRDEMRFAVGIKRKPTNVA